MVHSSRPRRRLHLRATLLACLPLLPLASSPLLAQTPATGEGTLALKRVLLSTGGVGYFEHEARVSGDAELTLEVRLDQVDDVLKSIVVYDDKGGVGTVSLPGREPLETAFRELPFGADDLTSPAGLLSALRGSELTATGARAVTGRLMSVTPETVQLPNGAGVTTRHRISVMTSEGLRQLVLEEADSLRFTDPAIQAKLDQALSAVSSAAGRERRRLTIRTTGGNSPSEQRLLRVAYVVEAPLWKSTYRLTLPPSGTGQEGKGQGDLQGWAVLENMSGEDWQDVELSVSSGNPVTFRQALYNSYYVDRAEVPVEVLGRVLPGVDEGAMPAAVQMAMPAPAAAMPRAKASGMAAAGGFMADTGGPAMERAMPPPPPRPAQLTAAESDAATAQVLFRYPNPVTLANGGTLMLPIASRAIPAERLALYQPDTQARHPLAALRLTNRAADGTAPQATALPPGVLTLYETVGTANAYVGDARLSALPAGESRLLSFAVDQDVTIDRDVQPSRQFSQAALADGVLVLTVRDRNTTRYRIQGPANEGREVLIEHPRWMNGWNLVEPAGAKPEITANAYRLPVKVEAGAVAELTVTMERPLQERHQLIDLPAERIAAFAASGDLPEAARKTLATLAEARAAVSRLEAQAQSLDNERERLVNDQIRLRDNLAALPSDSDLHKRTLARMGDQESRIEKLETDADKARQDAEAARARLAEQIRSTRL